MKHQTIKAFNSALSSEDSLICRTLMVEIDRNLHDAESKIWHGHPVWFLDENTIVGYSKLKDCIRLMFWSGVDFAESALKAGTGKFKDASIRYTSASEIDKTDLARWLSKARDIQWDYRNIRQRKGKLKKLTEW